MELQSYQHGLMRCEDTRFGFKIIVFCHGVVGDKPFYAFVAIDPQNFGYFESHYIENCYSEFSAFGKEILRGWGKTPPEDIIQHIKFKHGIDFGVDPAYILHLAGITIQTEERAQKPSTPFLDPQSSEYYEEYPEKPAEALSS